MRALGADEIDWPGIIAADRVGEDVGATDPHLLKLTIDDLVLLDATWSKQDDNHRSTELIDGRIYHTPARYGSRVWPTVKLMDAFREAVKPRTDGLWVGSRGSIASPPYDLPLPDIVLTHEPNGPDFIPAASVPLVVEVADTDAALDFFLGEKLRCYARMGIPEYWAANVDAGVLHQMWSPTRDGYAEHRVAAVGSSLVACALQGFNVEFVF